MLIQGHDNFMIFKALRAKLLSQHSSFHLVDGKLDTEGEADLCELPSKSLTELRLYPKG